MAINANTQSTAGGFILPNDRVDVLYTGQNSGENTLRSRTILRGVRVLAIDQSTEQTEASTVLGKTATLELTETQAEFITAAQATGSLSLALRPMVEVPGEASMEVMERHERSASGAGQPVSRISRSTDADLAPYRKRMPRAREHQMQHTPIQIEGGLPSSPWGPVEHPGAAYDGRRSSARQPPCAR